MVYRVKSSRKGNQNRDLLSIPHVLRCFDLQASTFLGKRGFDISHDFDENFLNKLFQSASSNLKFGFNPQVVIKGEWVDARWRI